jgi:hypothetical protein
MVIRFHFVFLGKGVINFKHFKALSLYIVQRCFD